VSSLPSRGAVPHLPEGVTVNGEEQPELIHYVMDLEALVRWFALPFRYQDQEGEWHQNEPIWTVYDEHGTYLPEADRLKRTWDRVMHDA
jgi:hypothetical protein